MVESRGNHGMSVSPPPPENLPVHRRPAEFGGTGPDPVWEFETEELPEGLRYSPDRRNPQGHGYIEPARRMSFEEYQRLLHSTRGLWRLVR
jgi:hypothetical protein